jgi:hypothetical protein
MSRDSSPRRIMTPDDEGFYEILHTAPPPTANRQSCFCVVDSQSLTLRWVSDAEMVDYTLGGEHEVMDEFWGVEDDQELVLL